MVTDPDIAPSIRADADANANTTLHIGPQAAQQAGRATFKNSRKGKESVSRPFGTATEHSYEPHDTGAVSLLKARA